MAKHVWVSFGAAVGLFAGAGSVQAADPWETPGIFGSDDTFESRNTLSHGSAQVHDLDQSGGVSVDQDWMIVPTIAGHSYEARLNSMVRFDWGTCNQCAQFERVSAAGAVLTDDVSTVNEGNLTEESYDRSVRWMATASTTNDYVRVRGDASFTSGPDAIYTVRFWDTTYSIPRWNNANGQVTVFLVNSLIQAPAAVRIDFYSSTGTLLASHAATINPNSLLSVSAGSIPALAGQSGHAYVAHTAGYGGLAGKAVALEPGTGFSFDTQMVPIPY